MLRVKLVEKKVQNQLEFTLCNRRPMLKTAVRFGLDQEHSKGLRLLNVDHYRRENLTNIHLVHV